MRAFFILQSWRVFRMAESLLALSCSTPGDAGVPVGSIHLGLADAREQESADANIGIAASSDTVPSGGLDR